MAEISASLVKQLRDMTGAGMMDCKRALEETGGDLDKAVDLLRKKGLAAAAKKASREAAEGIVDAYIHMGGKVGVLVEVNCETDFVARNEEFKEFVHDVALQIAAMRPRYVSKEEVPAGVLEHEREIYRAKTVADPRNAKKPPHIIDQIVEGQLAKFYKDNVLLEMDWVKDGSVTIGELLKQKIAKIGENIAVRRFALFVMGEGLKGE